MGSGLRSGSLLCEKATRMTLWTTILAAARAGEDSEEPMKEGLKKQWWLPTKPQVPSHWALVSPSNQKLKWSVGAVGGRGRMLTLRFPSAVMRSRLQVPQKCSDMDVMKLIWPRKPGILKA